MNNIITLLVSLLFGFGLALSGMTHTEKVLGFLDVAGVWDPSLLFVLGGAVSVTLVSFFFIRKLPKPLFADKFRLTDAKHVDRPLLVGSILFGVGWGISGYCPGPAIALLAAPNWELWVFLPAMLSGFVAHRLLHKAPQNITQPTPQTVQTDEPNVCG
ncbi:MAG: YeeE/YedE family protein [Gallionellaceae bacterium]|jgi:hypothetical protein